MKKLLIIFLFNLLIFNMFAQTEWKLATGSTVTFVIKNAGLKVDGKLEGLQTTIKFDSQNLATSSIEASLETTTINTDNKTRDGHLRKEDYFNVAKYPKMSIKSVSFSKDGNNGNTYKGKFKLTIKGVTKEIEIPFSYIENGNAATLKGSFTINRLDYTVGGNSWVMADNVIISLNILATK
jgi:polyisoprenoid-binding protein YceI